MTRHIHTCTKGSPHGLSSTAQEFPLSGKTKPFPSSCIFTQVPLQHPREPIITSQHIVPLHSSFTHGASGAQLGIIKQVIKLEIIKHQQVISSTSSFRDLYKASAGGSGCPGELRVPGHLPRFLGQLLSVASQLGLHQFL